MSGKKPSKGTPADRRLKANNPAGKPKSGGTAPKPKFGSPAWNAKYGTKPFGKK